MKSRTRTEHQEMLIAKLKNLPKHQYIIGELELKAERIGKRLASLDAIEKIRLINRAIEALKKDRESNS